MSKLTLRETTFELLNNKRKLTDTTLLEIAEATGLGFYWLQTFSKKGNQPNKDSGSDKIVALYNFLSPKKLKY